MPKAKAGLPTKLAVDSPLNAPVKGGTIRLANSSKSNLVCLVGGVRTFAYHSPAQAYPAAMNDNFDPTQIESPRHAEALTLLAQLSPVLDNATRSGFERIDSEGQRIFDFAYRRDECQRIVGSR